MSTYVRFDKPPIRMNGGGPIRSLHLFLILSSLGLINIILKITIKR